MKPIPLDDPFFAAVVRVFERAQGRVVIGDAAGNLVRLALPSDATTFRFVVEAQGLPNLLHEMLHFVQHGRLDVDHGIDYSRIPFDTDHAGDRRLLWEELACCALSCAYLDVPAAERRAWFEEQIGILHHFFGLDSTLTLRARIAALLVAHPGEWTRTLARAAALAESHLRDAGAAERARPLHDATLEDLFAAC